MKLVSSNTGLALRLGVLVTAMLFGQQALAVGTRAGTDVDNTVLVDYQVGGVDQTQLNATANFVVDRRVDFDLSVTDANLTPVVPGGPPSGDPDYYVEFTLTNTSNGEIDFDLVLTQIADVVFGTNSDLDSEDFTTVDYAVSADSVSGTDPDPVRGGPQFVDQLDADDSIRIRVYGDPQLGLLDGDIVGVRLDATGAEPGSAGATPLDDTTDDPADIDNVFVSGNAAFAEDGFIVNTTTLTATKIYNVIAGDLSSGKPIPGATVEYTITVDNPSTDTDATDVVVVDTFSGNVTLVVDGYDTGAAFSEDIEVVNGATTFRCTAASDGDNCTVAGTTLTVGGDSAITVAADDTLTVEFQVLIPDPATTP